MNRPLHFFFIVLMSSFSVGATPQEKPSSFILYFQPLFEFDHTTSSQYLEQVKRILSHNDSLEMEKLLLEKTKKPQCKKKRGVRCHSALYTNSTCIPNNKIPSRYCLKRSKKTSSHFFKEPVFNRIDWNRWAMGLNEYCFKKTNKTCKTLAEFHDQYMSMYKKLIKTRRKFRKKEQSKNF